ncbi:MAG: penicillin-binding protein 1B [Thiohalomonadaceae bacterium]
MSRLRPRAVLLALLAVFLAGLTALALFAVVLDFRVREEFDGRRFALPARVYARPLELFAGARLSPERFARELAQIGYKEGLQADEPGRFERRGNAFRVVTRPFVFGDGAQPSLSLELGFEDGHLVSLIDAADNTPVTLVRLDPEYIGGIYPAHNEDRVLVRLDEVPAHLVNGLLAVEDRKFRSHIGIDPRGMTRALLSTLSGGGVQGGSTLTQQLVKNFFLTPERTLKRKFTEVIMALLLEQHYDKDEILETYINEIYLGQDRNRAIHGFGLAAQFYFDKRLKDLTLTEAALLVGMVKGPSYYDPHRHPERALQRRNVALEAMRQEGYIDDAQYLKAKLAPLGVVAKPSMGTTPYPAFLDLVRRQLLQYYREEDLRSEGLQIFTTLDPQAQAAAETALSSRLAQLEKRVPRAKNGNGEGRRLEGAVVLADPQSGEIKALVGGRDPRFPGFNRAVDSRRPVGSLMKPVVYLTALSSPEHFTLISPLDDEPLISSEPGRPAWEPKNYDGTTHGLVPLRSALAHSYNIATARLGLAIGVQSVIDNTRRMGIERDMPPYAATLLGAVDLSPLDVAQMYQTFASGGFRAPLRAIREVLTAQGEPLQHYALSVEQVLDPAPVYLLTAALQGAVREGTGQGLSAWLPPGINAAGKTGTTDDWRDSWFAGYTGDRVAVVWVGHDDNSPTGFTGASGAMTVWGELMSRLDPEPLLPPMPENIERVWIDPASGLRADEACAGAVELPFIAGSAPEDFAPCARSGTRLRNWFRGLFQ